MKVCLSQVNPTIGDLKGNLQIIKNEMQYAAHAECDVLLLPEMVTTGYPPRDLLHGQWMWDAQPQIAEVVHKYLRGLDRRMTVIYGGIEQVAKPLGHRDRYNVAYVVDRDDIRTVRKRLLPQYDIFDEQRYFKSWEGSFRPVPITCDRDSKKSVTYCDVLICEDIWNNRFQGDNHLLPAAYDSDPVGELQGDGPLFVLNASPFWKGKVKQTQELVEDICRRINRQVCWVNQVGGHDEVVTGGYSMVTIPGCFTGNKFHCFTRQALLFKEDRMIVRLSNGTAHHDNLYEDIEPSARNNQPMTTNFVCGSYKKDVADEDFDTFCNIEAARLFIRDYMRRCGFKKVVLGLSGGIDSAVVAAIASIAIGGSNVIGATIPSEYSSEGSVSDSKELALVNGIDFRTISIDDLHKSVRGKFLSGGQPRFNHSVTDENIQPRLRALLLMAISNDEDALLLTTGNKSEGTIGYCTLYGDMCGGLSVIMDFWKSEVYEAARFLNKYSPRPLVPESIISKAPSAELKPDQKDTDSLPRYEILDPILEAFVERDMLPDQVVRSGIVESEINVQMVNDLYRRYRNSEYKRQQMPPSLKIKRRSFGYGRRMPIASKTSKLS